MADFETVKAEETLILVTEIGGCKCEVVEIGGIILLYVDGYFEGKLYEEESAEDYISQIEEILD